MPKDTIDRIAVLGAGNMGSGIAQKYATEGFPVVLVDTDDDKVARGLASIEQTLNDGVARRLFRPERVQDILSRIFGCTDWSQLSDADLVIEAVFEDLQIKQNVFARLEDICRADCVLATNTSSFSVADIAATLKRPQRLFGLHYFFHPAKNRLVEVVSDSDADPAALDAVWKLQERIGKTPIAAQDRQGFVVNRFFVPWLNEAVRMHEEGLADIATIDAAAKQVFGVGMGPFELMNVTGIPIAFHSATSLCNAFGEFYAPASLLARQVEAQQDWELGGKPEPGLFDAVGNRLIGAAILVAAQLVHDGVSTIEDTDIGARVGLRWPLGPFQLANRVGIKRAADFAAEIAGKWDLSVPKLLADHAARDHAFSFELVRTDIADGIATLKIMRPDAMNALNEEVVAQLETAFTNAEHNAAVRAIVIAGSGKDFVGGADIRFFLRNIEHGTLDNIVTFTRRGQSLLNAIAECEKTVVAKVQGMALGGGLELALACDYIAASDRARVAFPETGIGIYPGLGGTQRTPARVGVGLAKFLIFSGQMISAHDARKIGLIDAVVSMDRLDAEVQRLAAMPADPNRQRAALPDHYQALRELFTQHSGTDFKEGRVESAAAVDIHKLLQRLTTKAPIAMRLAGEMIERSAELSLADGLELELAHLTEIFATQDAYAGLQSVGGQAAPEFLGR